MTAIVFTGERGSPGSDVPRHLVNLINARSADCVSIASLSALQHQPPQFRFGHVFLTGSGAQVGPDNFTFTVINHRESGLSFMPCCAIEQRM